MPLPCSSILQDDTMDLGLTEAQELLKTSVRFCAARIDKNTLLALERVPTGITPDLLRKVADSAVGSGIPEAYGGEGRSLTDAAVLFEELGRRSGAWTLLRVGGVRSPGRAAWWHRGPEAGDIAAGGQG